MKIILVLLLGLFVAHPAALTAAPVTVLNSNFEDPDIITPEDPAYSTLTDPVLINFANLHVGPLSGWTFTSPTAAAAAWGFSPFATSYNPTTLTSGQVVYANANATISQVLSATLAQNMTYTLTVATGRRKDEGCIGCAADPGATIALYATDGTTDRLLNSYTVARVADGNWVDIQVRYTSSSTTTEQLKIVLGASAPQANFDNVRVDASTPEPGAIFLAGAGLFVAGLLRRYKLIG